VLDDDKEYLTITVRRRHGGLEIREKLFGHQIATKKQFKLVPGAFIISRIQCWHQAYAIVGDFPTNEIASSNYDQFAISPDVDPRFFWWLSHGPAFTETVRSSAVGVVIEKMVFNRDKWLRNSVRLPPLTEQQRVVAVIEGLAAQIHEARTLRQQAAEEADRLIFAECEEKLLHAERNFSGQPLGEIIIKEGGISYGVVLTGPEVDGGVPTLRAGDLQWFECNTNRVKRVAPEIERGYQRTRLRGGEVLLRIRGGVGALAVCPEEMIGGNVSREIAVIPVTNEIEPRFAMFLLAAATNQERMSGHVKGTSYVGINLKDVRTLRLPVPPLSEQRRMVAELEALKTETDALKPLQAETATELNALLPSILDRAFNGEL